MKQVEMWPPPDWAEVVITWKTMLANADKNPNKIIEWVDRQPGGNYHLHGWQSTEGFAFRFEREADATAFALRWS